MPITLLVKNTRLGWFDMKAPRLTLFLVLCSLCFTANASSNYQVGSTMYVWEPEGLKLHQNPDEKSKAIAYLQYGDAVKVVRKTSKKSNFRYAVSSDPQPDFYDNGRTYTNSHVGVINGAWALVVAGGKTGYVSDTRLSQLPTLRCLSVKAASAQADCEAPDKYSSRVFKALSKKSWLDRAKGYATEHKLIRYGNGVTIKETSDELSGSHVWTLPGYCFDDGILLARITNSLESGLSYMGLSPGKILRYRNNEVGVTRIYIKGQDLIIESSWAD